MTYRMFCKEQNGPSRGVYAVDLLPCKLKKRRSFRSSQPEFPMTSIRNPEVKKKLTFDVLAVCCFVLIDCVEVCITEKGYKYGVSFSARNESELEGGAFLCGQKQQRTRDPPLGSVAHLSQYRYPFKMAPEYRASGALSRSLFHQKS